MPIRNVSFCSAMIRGLRTTGERTNVNCRKNILSRFSFVYVPCQILRPDIYPGGAGGSGSRSTTWISVSESDFSMLDRSKVCSLVGLIALARWNVV